ncbi:MAG TPA: nucleotidyltransferase family protein [Thiobacillaceae bacterium]|nr:nucleotidyltransferase family protein [Thiobacillaceae bacterium]
MIQALLLAAGAGRRFGADKRLHPLADGTPMALAAARNLIQALPGALAVVGEADQQLADLLTAAGLAVTCCPDAARGMGASLAWGVAQRPEADGWLIALADMPFIRPATFHRVAEAVTGPAVIAAPVFDGKRGHPVAFGVDYREALLGLDGDRGGRDLLATHPDRLRRVPCDDPGVLRDIDHKADLS